MQKAASINLLLFKLYDPIKVTNLCQYKFLKAIFF